MILDSENTKQDGVKAETKISCPNGYMSCDGRIVCMCNWNCDCSDCADEPPRCFEKGELDQKYINLHAASRKESLTKNI